MASVFFPALTSAEISGAEGIWKPAASSFARASCAAFAFFAARKAARPSVVGQGITCSRVPALCVTWKMMVRKRLGAVCASIWICGWGGADRPPCPAAPGRRIRRKGPHALEAIGVGQGAAEGPRHPLVVEVAIVAGDAGERLGCTRRRNRSASRAFTAATYSATKMRWLALTGTSLPWAQAGPAVRRRRPSASRRGMARMIPP